MAAISSSITLQLPERDNVKVYAVVINSRQNITVWSIPLHLDHTLQFCVGNRCLVIQLEENQPCPPFLIQFMHDQHKFAFTCSQVALKMRPLEMALGGIQGTMMVIIDLWNYAEPISKKWDIMNSFGPANDQGVVYLDWGGPNAYQLSPPQVYYACVDAFLNIHIANYLWNISLLILQFTYFFNLNRSIILGRTKF